MPNIIHANGIDIWYDSQGTGPVLALSHGWRGHTANWPPNVFDLRDHVRLLVYDVRGHGKTTSPEDIDSYSMPQYAADLRGLLDALDIPQAHIAGVSQGGMISAQFACDYPERARSLLLCDTTAGNGLDEGPGGVWERTIHVAFPIMEALAEKEGLAALAERRIAYDRENDARYFDFPEALETREARDRASYTDMSLAAFTGTARAIAKRPDLTARIRELHMPALVMVGEWDDFRPSAERDHGLLQGSRFVLVRRADHSIDRWRPDVWAPTIAQFVADVEAGRDVAGEREL